VPSSLRWQYLLRGMLGPLLDRSFKKIAPDVDALTEAKVHDRGQFAGGFYSRQVRQFESGGTTK